MGNSAVAVLHYDHFGEINRSVPRVAEAMRDKPSSPDAPVDFGFGAVVSLDHANGYQVCVIHGNTGWRVGVLECPPPDDVLAACANALSAHGWTVRPRSNRR